MHTATVYFSDKSTLTVTEGDYIIPVTLVVRDNEEPFTSMGTHIEIYSHTHDGLIPAITTALCQCSFFYLNRNGKTIYSANAVVKVENN